VRVNRKSLIPSQTGNEDVFFQCTKETRERLQQLAATRKSAIVVKKAFRGEKKLESKNFTIQLRLLALKIELCK
jgi:hypothetical protein